MKIRDWVDKKLKKTVDACIEPVRQNVLDAKDNAENKLTLWSGLLKTGVCLAVGWMIMKTGGGHTIKDQKNEPGTIVINNYINTKEDANDR